MFLKVIHLLEGRLYIFPEALGFFEDLKKYNISCPNPGLSEKFFKMPWVPTVFMCIQTNFYQKQPKSFHKDLAKLLSLSIDQLNEAIKVLSDLQMIQITDGFYKVRKGAYYAPASMKGSQIDKLYNYWFSRSSSFYYHYKGYQKLDQAAVSYESYCKIIGWVAELRDKIREEVRSSKSEMVIHMHWQIVNLFSELEKENPCL